MHTEIFRLKNMISNYDLKCPGKKKCVCEEHMKQDQQNSDMYSSCLVRNEDHYNILSPYLFGLFHNKKL